MSAEPTRQSGSRAERISTAIVRALVAIRDLPPRTVFYSSLALTTAGAVALGGNIDSGFLPYVVALGDLGINLLASQVDRWANADETPPGEARQAVEDSLATLSYRFDQLLTEATFQRALARQMRELHVIEVAIRESTTETVAMLLAESRQFEAFSDEMRAEFQSLHHRMGTLATGAQAERIIALLEGVLEREPSQRALSALHQLPSPPSDFTGREDELAKLRAVFDPMRPRKGAAISSLRGLGGVGKTALGLVYAHELAKQFPDGQFFFNLRGQPDSDDPATPAEALKHVIRAIVPDARLPDDEAQLVAIYRDRLHDKHALIFMDNARDAAQVAPLVPPPSCAMLVTSRETFAIPGMRAIPLDSLPQADAEALLLAIAPRIGEDAPKLAATCECLPYALRVAGDYLAASNVSVRDYLNELKAEQRRNGLIEGAITLSYNRLTTDQQQRVRRLAEFSEPFEVSAAAEILEIGPDEGARRTTTAYLDEFLRYSLLAFDEATGRFRMHDLARAQLRRDPRLDYLRGFALVAMFVDYLGSGSWFRAITGGSVFFVSAAEGYVFISGLTVGIVYGELMRQKGWLAIARKILVRARTLYLLAVTLTLLFAAAIANLHLPFGSEYQLGDPMQVAVSVVTLQRTFAFVDLPLLYVQLLLLAPLPLALLQRRLKKLLLALSVALWGFYQLAPDLVQGIPWPIEGNLNFHLISWQLLFIAAIILGYHHGDLSIWFRARSHFWLYAALAAGFVLLLALYPQIDFSTGAGNLLFSKNGLGAGRLAAGAIVFPFLYLTLTWFWTPIHFLTGRLFTPFGENSLYGYTLLVLWLIAYYAIVPPLAGENNITLNSVLQAGAILLTRLSILHRFGFRVIPR